MLEIKKLKKYFGGVKAVNNCSFQVTKGLITALIGPNGSGKSTVFNIISGVEKPDDGKIVFNNTDITHFSPDAVSNTGISRLFQKSQLFENLTVTENLLLALNNDDTKFWKNIIGRNIVSKEDYKRITSIIKKLEIEKVSHTICRELSYGQKRLTEIARTVLNPHQLLILDEPVAGINPKIRSKLIKFFKVLKDEGTTILLIEHDMNFALSVADHVVVLNQGKVLTQGNPIEIKNNKKVLEIYLGE